MKKLFGCILSLVVAVMLVFTPAEHVYAQGLGLSVSSSSIAVGKTVKVTVSMPSGYFGTVVISSSDEGVLSNGGDGVANIYDWNGSIGALQDIPHRSHFHLRRRLQEAAL